MLHRIKKENDVNHDKWIGVGGKFQDDESPEECLLREVREETGYDLLDYRLRGIITFISDKWETEYMYLYTADCFTGTQIECDEGELVWVRKDEMDSHSISFPLISSGIFGGNLENPVAESTKQCIRAYKKFVETYPDYEVDVKLCAFTDSEMSKAKKEL